MFNDTQLPQRQLADLLKKHRIPRRSQPHLDHYVRTGKTTRGLARLRSQFHSLPADDNRVYMFMLDAINTVRENVCGKPPAHLV
jgi:hypothetical protein